MNREIKPKERKAFLYGGHDSTIANLLSALNVFDPQVPGYGVAIMLEFSKDRITNEYGVEVCFYLFFVLQLFFLFNGNNLFLDLLQKFHNAPSLSTSNTRL